MEFLIIGGSDAGISAALRARECDSSADIRVMRADAYPYFSICGLPFFLSGETADWRELVHRTEFEGIELLKDWRAHHIDVARQTVLAQQGGVTQPFSFDRLVIGTGASPVLPPIAGLEHDGVFFLHTMEDSFRCVIV